MNTIARRSRQKARRSLCALALGSLALLWLDGPGFEARAVAAPQELAIIAHLEAPASVMSPYEVEAIFTRSQTRWSNGVAVVPLNAPAGSDVRTAFDRAVLRLEPDQVGRFWLDRRIRGLGLPPRHVADPGLTLKVVANLKGAIGYVDSQMATSQVRVVARVRNGRLVGP